MYGYIAENKFPRLSPLSHKTRSTVCLDKFSYFPLNEQLDFEFGKPGDVDLAKRCADKKVIIVGLPGAFTPT